MPLDPQLKNRAVATLAAGIDNDDTSLSLATGGGALLPDRGPWVGVIWNATDYANSLLDPAAEFVRVGGGYGTDALSSLTRGVGGSAAVNHNAGGKTYKIAQVLTAESLDQLPRPLVAGAAGATLSGAATTTPLATLTLPANTLGAGDVLEVYLRLTRTGTAATASARLTLGSVVGGSFTVSASETSGVYMRCRIEVGAGGAVVITGDGARITSAAILVAPIGSGTATLTGDLTLAVEVGTSAVHAADSLTLALWRVVHHKA